MNDALTEEMQQAVDKWREARRDAKKGKSEKEKWEKVFATAHYAVQLVEKAGALTEQFTSSKGERYQLRSDACAFKYE